MKKNANISWSALARKNNSKTTRMLTVVEAWAFGHHYFFPRLRPPILYSEVHMFNW